MYLFPDKNIIYSQSKGSSYLGYFITYFIIFKKDSIFSLYFNEESKKKIKKSETGQINTFVK